MHQFNAEIPTFDSALAASNEVKTTNAHAKTLSSATVDWGTVLSQLDTNTPAGLAITDFAGTGGPSRPQRAGASVGDTREQRPRREPSGPSAPR